MRSGQGADSGDPERVFEALPPAPGRGFAQTWWGRAWLTALEDTALDSGQLARGRLYARQGAVGAVSVRPGRITAVVRDRDGTPHRSDVLLREFGETEWDRLLETVAGRAGHIAALLDRDMPPHLVEDAAAAGVELLPGIGDLEPECTCGAWDHCPHTAALSYQTARLLDGDPLVLLLMRGRGERALLTELQVRSAARACRDVEAGTATDPGPDDEPDAENGGSGQDRRGAEGGRSTRDRRGAEDGVPARAAFAAAGALPPLPPPPAPLAEPGRPPLLTGGTDPAPGLDVPALEFLASDAAARAALLLADALSSSHHLSPVPEELTPGRDAVRLAAAGPAAPIAARLADGSGRDGPGMALAVRAWRQGGPAALAVLEEDWAPGPDALARAMTELSAAWADQERAPRLRATGNRWTAVGTDAQLRYGRDGRWWPYRKERGRWCPAGPAGVDPAAALALLLDGTD